MKFILYLFTGLFIIPFAFAQNDSAKEEDNFVDSKYREDQFYFGITYNLLSNKPSGMSQNGFSSGIHFGMIRDMPINEKRNKSIGIGLGLSFNSFNQNMLIAEDTDRAISFSILDNNVTSFTKNKFYSHLIELPIQYRWRTSTETEYKFWRIYTGIKLGYVLANASKYEGKPNDVRIKGINAFNDFQYGLTLTAGYNTWNFHVYYALNPIFKTGNFVNSDALDTRALKVGLMFYIL